MELNLLSKYTNKCKESKENLIVNFYRLLTTTFQINMQKKLIYPKNTSFSLLQEAVKVIH